MCFFGVSTGLELVESFWVSVKLSIHMFFLKHQGLDFRKDMDAAGQP
jgi:hypothetical protein